MLNTLSKYTGQIFGSKFLNGIRLQEPETL